MAVRSMEMAETAMETEGDGSRGTSLSRQGAGTETSIPRNSSAAAAELRNSSGNFADSPTVFCREASYRRRGAVRGGPGWPHVTTSNLIQIRSARYVIRHNPRIIVVTYIT
jgi:hypothetical protein